MRKAFFSIFLAVPLLAACANQGQGPGQFGANKTTAGTVLGAVGGGFLGSQIGGGSGRLVAVGAGTLLGAVIGNEVGSSLDRADIAYARQAEARAYSAPIGQQITWNNPESGNHGSYVATRDGNAADGSYCREYQSTIVVGGQTQQGYGTACRQEDGSWKIEQ